jgi:polyprenyl-phospho-N-acetylgalactosaminyl synthase
MQLFIIIPAYNEENKIAEVVSSLTENGLTNIIVVDDGSKKPLNNILKSNSVCLIRHPVNLGQGAALQTGMNLAMQKGADIVVHFDADDQHLASDIHTLIAPLIADEADVVFGSRFLAGSKSNTPISKKILLQIARYVNKLFTGYLLTDAHNGLRALNKKALQKIKITENRMAHATEILSLIKENKLRLCEVPVSIIYSKYSIEKGQNFLHSVNILFDLLLRKLKS